MKEKTNDVVANHFENIALQLNDHRGELEFDVDQKMALVLFDKHQQIEPMVSKGTIGHVDHSKALKDLMKKRALRNDIHLSFRIQSHKSNDWMNTTILLSHVTLLCPTFVVRLHVCFFSFLQSFAPFIHDNGVDVDLSCSSARLSHRCNQTCV